MAKGVHGSLIVTTAGRVEPCQPATVAAKTA